MSLLDAMTEAADALAARGCTEVLLSVWTIPIPHARLRWTVDGNLHGFDFPAEDEEGAAALLRKKVREILDRAVYDVRDPALQLAGKS